MSHVPQRQPERAGRPNENYARELMELFCLGPNGAGRHAELHAGRRRGLARALTGWRLNSIDDEPDYGKVHVQPGSLRDRRQDVPRPHAAGARPHRERRRRARRRQRRARRGARPPEPRAVPDPQAVGASSSPRRSPHATLAELVAALHAGAAPLRAAAARRSSATR